MVALANADVVDRASVVFDFLPGREFAVEFEEIETQADPRTQTFALTVSMPAPEDVRIVSGMTAAFRLYVKPEFRGATGGIPVVSDALFVDEAGNPFLWRVKDDMTVEKVAVKVGDLALNQVFVREGVAPGDRIVTAGVHHLQEGMEVRRMETRRSQ